jgi:hypothetical protein
MAMVVMDRGTVDRAELSSAVRRRWADATLANLEDEQPSVNMTTSDAVELATLRRGAEPLRLLVLPQSDPGVRSMPIIEPMPIRL